MCACEHFLVLFVVICAGWVVSGEGHQWSVKLDVRDLGGHLDTTFHGWSSTLASRVRPCYFSVSSCLCSSFRFSW